MADFLVSADDHTDSEGEGEEEHENPGEAKEPKNRVLPHILKIATMSLPIVGEDGFLYGTDIKGRLEAENFKGNGTLEMAKPSYKRRWQAPDLRTMASRRQTSGSAPTEKRH